MLDTKLLTRMLLLSRETVVATFIAYQRKCNDRIEKARAAMSVSGYEEVQCDNLLLPDGREVVNLWGKKWALTVEAHKAKLEKEMEAAYGRDAAIAMTKPETAETKSVAGTDDSSEMVCPKCGDVLQYSVVCRACAAGKAGYMHRYSCVQGCVDFVSKEKI